MSSVGKTRKDGAALAALALAVLVAVFSGAANAITLVTPYVNESDMATINEAFSVDACNPWGFEHRGVDFFPTGTDKPFQAACGGTVDSIELFQNPGNGFWQVNVSITCGTTEGVGYAFEPFSDQESDGNIQLSQIIVTEGQSVSQGDLIGTLLVVDSGGAHVDFAYYSQGEPVCPAQVFTPEARASVLNLLEVIWPHSRICYGLPRTISSAAISADGNPTDWLGIAAEAGDWENDDTTTPAYDGDDIEALYLARDSSNLYLHLNLWEDVNPLFQNHPPPHEGRYSFSIMNDGPFPDLYFSVAYDASNSVWSLGHNGSNGPGTPPQLQGPQFVGVSGDVIEVVIPLFDIGDPHLIFEARGEVTVCCVDPENWTIILDETHCVTGTQFGADTSCTYSISPTSQSLGSSLTSGSFDVTTQSGCTWTASSSTSWIHITGGSSGNGNGTVSYTVDANSSSQRSGTIQAAGNTFIITQSGAPTSCTYSISPTSRSFGANGGTATVSVTTTSGCSWTAASNNSWINITGGSSGTGNGTVSYSVSANATTSSSSGTMTIAGKTFSVSQEGASGPPPSGEFTYYSVIAHTPGSFDSLWVSSTSLCNLSSVRADAVLTYQYGNNKSVEKSVSVPGNGIVEWLDTTSDLFGLTGDSSGVVEIEVDAPLQVAVRTFNSSDIGTFGQSLPGASIDQSMTQGETGTISPVKKTPEFRTNIGFINTGQIACTVDTVFLDGNGSQIGNPVPVSLAPGRWKQINNILGKAGIDYAPIASAVITVRTADSKVWAYATVIDNATGDPTGLPLTEVN